MCMQLRQTGVLCVYNSSDDSIGINRWQHGKDTHTHIAVMEVTALHNVTHNQPQQTHYARGTEVCWHGIANEHQINLTTPLSYVRGHIHTYVRTCNPTLCGQIIQSYIHTVQHLMKNIYCTHHQIIYALYFMHNNIYNILPHLSTRRSPARLVGHIRPGEAVDGEILYGMGKSRTCTSELAL